MKRSICVLFLMITLFLATLSFSTADSLNATIYVDDDGTADYTSIQDAIDSAVDGDTIFVYAGQYHESIRIDKSLHIIGEDKYETIINETRSGPLVDINHAHVHFEGFTLIDDASVWSDSVAVIFVNSNGNSIENNIIITDLYNGIKLHPRTKENSITRNVITARYAGIRLEWSWNNQISGNHLVDQQVGINMDYSFKNNIQQNHFEDNGMGVFLIDCYGNNFSQNNFIDKGDDVYMHPRFSVNSWNNNYWKDYVGKIPFHIVTQRYIPFTNIPLVFWFDLLRIDWNPASVPFDIDGGII